MGKRIKKIALILSNNTAFLLYKAPKALVEYKAIRKALMGKEFISLDTIIIK